jgi:large repetitive protein
VSLDLLWDYFVDGMNYTPAGPRYEDMRNGVVQSAVNRGLGHQCLIWRAFADFGVGVGASGSCSGSIFVRWTVSESFDLPAECLGNTAPVVDTASPAQGATVSGTVFVSISASDAQDAAGTLNVQWNVDGGAWQPATYNAGTQRYEASWNSASVADGSHTINARATDSGSLIGADSNSVTVNNVNDPPVAVFTYSCSGLTCNFNASSSTDPDSNISSYSWTFGDGASASGVTASRTYAAPSTYTVTLVVTDSGGLSDDEVKSVTVNADSLAPTISSISPTSMQRGTSSNMTINGTNFVSGASVTFVDGSGPTPTASNVTFLNSGQLTCTVTVPGGGAPRDRVWSVRVTNPDGKSATLTGAFTVTP